MPSSGPSFFPNLKKCWFFFIASEKINEHSSTEHTKHHKWRWSAFTVHFTLPSICMDLMSLMGPKGLLWLHYPWMMIPINHSECDLDLRSFVPNNINYFGHLYFLWKQDVEGKKKFSTRMPDVSWGWVPKLWGQFYFTYRSLVFEWRPACFGSCGTLFIGQNANWFEFM